MRSSACVHLRHRLARPTRPRFKVCSTEPHERGRSPQTNVELRFLRRALEGERRQARGHLRSLFASVEDVRGHLRSLFASVEDVRGHPRSLFASVEDVRGHPRSLFTSISDVREHPKSVFATLSVGAFPAGAEDEEVHRGTFSASTITVPTKIAGPMRTSFSARCSIFTRASIGRNRFFTICLVFRSI